MSYNNNAPIAVVGISAQLPSGDYSEENLNHRTLWNFLLEKRQAFEKIPGDRFNIDAWKGSAFGKIITDKGAFLKRTTQFDNLEFGISNKDAKSMSLSTRRLIELSFLALLDSGIDTRGQNIGSFMCGSNLELMDQDEFDAQGSFGNVPSSMSNRVSYTLDLQGPSLSLDTACSSSLTALHLAIRSIQSGDCSAALVGGAQYNHRLWDWINYSQGGVLTPDGISKPFDAHAHGLTRGEGAVVIVVKPLAAALADNDKIYTTILGSSINSSGSEAPLHVPNGPAQQACILSAYAQAGRAPTDADYVELHATGTAVGDPIESNAAGEIFARPDGVVIGSIKGNIGHLESTAFLASLLKTCLVFKNGVIPPNVNFQTANPNIHWKKYGLNVPTEPTPLGCRSPSGKSLISLSSSGIGGSNGHVVLEAPPLLTQPAHSSIGLPGNAPILFVAGGLSSQAAQKVADSIIQSLPCDTSRLAQLAVTHSRRARQLPWRTYAIVTPGNVPSFSAPSLVARRRPPLVFVFAGQGPQNIEMGRQLFQTYSIFKNSVLEMDQLYEKIVGVSLLESTGLFRGERPSKDRLPAVWPVDITVPALAMVQIALFDLMVGSGISPDLMVGHSAGEAAIVYASGAGSKAMALEIAIARGRAMTCTEDLGGAMAAVGCELDRVKQLVAKVAQEDTTGGTIEVACHNALDAMTISGSAALVEKAIAIAKSEGIFAQRIRTAVPGHSSLMEACKDKYRAMVGDVFARYPGTHEPRIPVYSSVTGVKLSDPFTAEYFWLNVRQPVLFHEALSLLLADLPSQPAVVEISPHPVLATSILSCGVPPASVLCPMRRVSRVDPNVLHELVAFSDALGRLAAVLGINSVDLTEVYGRPTSDDAYEVPLYPFAAKQLPFHSENSSFTERLQPSKGPLCSSRLRMNAKTHPTLGQHVINGEPILPASGFIEMVLETGAQVLWNVEFNSILSLSVENPIKVIVESHGAAWSVNTPTINSTLLSEKPQSLKTHAVGYMSTIPLSQPPSAPLDLTSIKARLRPLDLSGFYESLKRIADFGPVFQRAVHCAGGFSEVLAEIRGISEEEASEGYRFHPAVIDACIHILLHPDIIEDDDEKAYYLPSKVAQFAVHRPTLPHQTNFFSHIVLRQWTPYGRVYDVAIVDSTGARLCTIEGLEVQRHTSTPPPVITKRFDLIFQPVHIDLGPSKNVDGYFKSPDRGPAHELYRILDRLAYDIIDASLQAQPTVGNELHRQRYFDFAKQALQSHPPPLPANIEEIRQQWPAHFEITERVSRVHKDVFASSRAAVEALYSDDLMTRFYDPRGLFAPICQAAAQAFDETIQVMTTKGGKRALKVLEVGAGTGLLTGCLTDILKQKEDIIVEYTVSDVSFALASTTARKTSYVHAVPAFFDASKDPEEQGLVPGSYDIITALHVLHATPDLAFMLRALRRLLVPGGRLLVVELDGASWAKTPGTLWLDCIFGAFAEWFSYTDGRTHCTRTPAIWRDLLQNTGYTNVHTQVEKGGGFDFLYHAQADDADPVSRSVDLPLPTEEPVLLDYQYGQELTLQQRIGELEADRDLILWITATAGVDGDAAMGLVQTLAREFTAWEVRLAIFGGTWDRKRQAEAISRHQLKGEPIIYFTQDGQIQVPRVVPSSSPTGYEKFDAQSTWVQNGSDVVQSSLPPLEDYEASVEVHAWSHPVFSLGGFTGHIIDSQDGDFTTGQAVVGIAASQVTNRVVVHTGCLSTSAVPATDQNLTSVLLASVIGALVLGPAQVTRRDRKLSRRRILLVGSGHELDGMLLKFFQSVSKYVALEYLRDANKYEEIASLNRGQFDVIVVDSKTGGDHPELSHGLSGRGKVFLWDTTIRQLIRDDPWVIGHALEAGMLLAADMSPSSPGVSPQEVVTHLEGKSVAVAKPLFDHSKAYVLLGGIGGLGIHIAVWMYKNGAKYILLTSRRGRASLDPISDASSLRKLVYLETQKDLVLHVASSDATSAQETTALLKGISLPIGGCFLMPLVLSDHLFMRQTEEDFRAVHATKLGALNALEHAVSIDRLDFLVGFSSVAGLLGSAGQSNYASACTAMTGALSRYSNAFSLIVPGVSDVGYLARSSSSNEVRDTLKESNLTGDDICACLGDGILKLSQGTQAFSQYIPDLRWNVIDNLVGLTAPYRHLRTLEEKHFDLQDDHGGEDANILDIVLAFLDVEKDDFSADVPFTAYGLDSVVAARVAAAVRPYVTVSPLQLLGDMSWAQLDSRIQEQGAASAQTNPAGTGAERDVSTESTIVELRNGKGVPLIVLHDLGGSIDTLLPLQNKFYSPLWAIQVTKDTPIDSLSALSAFHVKKIKEKRPVGPYRIASFSASSTMALALTRALEANGDQVVQLAFLDHFPLLFTAPSVDTTHFVTEDGIVDDVMLKEGLRAVAEMHRYSKGADAGKIGEDIEKAYRGTGASDLAIRFVSGFKSGLQLLANFFVECGEGDSRRFAEAFSRWVEEVKAPVSIYVASDGIVKTLPPYLQPQWQDLGAKRCFPDAKVYTIKASHFDLLRDDTVAKNLQEEWR